MKNKILTLFLATSLATSVLSIGAYAKDGPSDYYESYDKSSRIEVGDDISEGRYVLFNNQDTRSASVSIKNDGKNILTDSFWYNYIIEVDDEDVIYLTNCYLVDYDDAYVFSPEEGFFEVGKHIDAGDYYIEWVRGDKSANCVVYDKLYYTNDDEYKDSSKWRKTYSVSGNGHTKVELEEGQYVKLDGCRLVYSTKDD